MREALARAFYSLAWWLLTPALLLHLAYRARRQREYLEHVGERFGLYPSALRQASPSIWIHAVSVGETRAAEPLLKALVERYPHLKFVISHTTPTGRATPLSVSASLLRVYLPYDFAFAARRFMKTFNPAIAIFMETEVWPNLVSVGASRGMPMVLANGRLSKRSARRARRVVRLIKPALGRLRLVLAQGTKDARRLTLLGAHCAQVVGNVKFDQGVPDGQLELGIEMQTLWGDRAVFLAASTREGEESLLLDAWRTRTATSTNAKDALLVIVPRHMQRLSDLEKLLSDGQWRYQRRSEGCAVPADCDIVLGDTMGEMAAYYASATVAYVGGGLLPFGTHNLIEACAVGCPVLLGPHTFNFADAARRALHQGAALQLADASAVVAAADRVIDDAALRAEMSQAGRLFAQAHRGATARTIAALAPLIDEALRGAVTEAAVPRN